MEKRNWAIDCRDKLWARLEPLLPDYKTTHPLGGGPPARADRDLPAQHGA